MNDVSSKFFDISRKRIWADDHRGMMGGALVRRLAREACEILTVAHGDVDLTRQADVERWLDKQRPDVIVLATARVGGIHANSSLPAKFLSINPMIGTNIVSAARKMGARRLVNLGSSCMYPVDAPRRLLDSGRLAALGSPVSNELADGWGQMYRWCCNNKVNAAA